jgi:hypothetical protein
MADGGLLWACKMNQSQMLMCGIKSVTVQGDDHRAHDAQCASDPSKEGQGLFEED